jgi:membrane-associated phospholipid phosphatase
LVYLFRRQSWRYPLWRNTLAITTGLALIGFALFPLMPPRLLPSSFHIADTLRTVGGLWSFDSGPMSKVSNQYAAMPSLHFAWALWSAAVLAPAVRHLATKILVWCYPAVTLLCIVVTGNHYIFDALGGAITLAAGYGGARLLTRTTDHRHRPREREPASTPTVARSRQP